MYYRTLLKHILWVKTFVCLFPCFLYAQPATSVSAIVYSDQFSGQQTASGELYAPNNLTIAHRNLPLYTKVRLIDTQTQSYIEAVVNDRVGNAEAQDIRVSHAIGTRFNLRNGQSKRLFLVNLGMIPNPPSLANASPIVTKSLSTIASPNNVGSGSSMLITPNLGQAPFTSDPLASNGSGRFIEKGLTTYYSDAFEGRRTKTGEIFRQNDYMAAHKSLPMGTKVRVVNPRNGKSVNVRIADLMPPTNPNMLSITRRAAEEIGLIQLGKAEMELYILDGTTQTTFAPNTASNVPIAVQNTPMARSNAGVTVSVPSTRTTSVSNTTTLANGIPTFDSGGMLLETGVATFYNDRYEGNRTTSGEPLRQNEYTAAHKTLPMGTKVRVVNPRNGKSVIVRINDKMPASNTLNMISLTRRAAEEIDILRLGRVPVELYQMGSSATTGSLPIAPITVPIQPNVVTDPVTVTNKIRPPTVMPQPNQQATWDGRTATLQKGSVVNSGAIAPSTNGVGTQILLEPLETSRRETSSMAQANFTVQVGAVGSEQAAKAEVRKWQNAWYEPIEGRNLYRVCVGKYATDAEAEVALRTIKAKNPRAFVRQLF